MIDLFLAIPASDEDREDGPKSSYVSAKDVKWVTIALVILGIALLPVFDILKKTRDSSLCISQLRKISSAITQYAENNDQRFPPVVQVGPGSPGAPYVQDNSIYSWVSLVQRLDPTINFVCPAAKDDEKVPNQITDREKGKLVIDSTYGMYAAYSGAPISSIERSTTFLIAETSNFGSQGSFDPVKFTDPDKKPIPYDGFAIGWNNSNSEPGPTTRSVTRLAFRKSADGNFGSAYGRHGDIIHALTVDGQAATLRPSEAQVHSLGGQLSGRWATPPILP